MFASLFSHSCKVADIREVDWYKHENRQYDYGVITYYCVSSTGARLYEDRHEDLRADEAGPDYTYECQACGGQFWFWSAVMQHVTDIDEPDSGQETKRFFGFLCARGDT